MKSVVKSTIKQWIVLVVVMMMMTSGAGSALAKDKAQMGGWEQNGAYDKHYNPNEYEKFRAWVIKVEELVPMDGMSPGVALEVKEDMEDDETIIVHLCPTWYLTKDDVSIRKGDRVKLKGAWAEIDGKDVFIAAKVIKGDYYEFKVRLTSNGKPFWTMTPEELEKERRSQ